MKDIGIMDASVDEHCYVTGHIPATSGFENTPKIGFIAHLDTAPDSSGENVKPVIHENFDGNSLDIGAAAHCQRSCFLILETLRGKL